MLYNSETFSVSIRMKDMNKKGGKYMSYSSEPVSNDDRMFAMLIYVSAIFSVFIIGPLIIYILKKDSPFVTYHVKEYFNFLISYTIYLIISGILAIILIGILLAWIIGIMMFILMIVAAVRAFEGKEYRFPFTIRFI